jgi:RIO-like serine/threonine protein kinase
MFVVSVLPAEVTHSRALSTQELARIDTHRAVRHDPKFSPRNSRPARRFACFEREARTIASLNHPNICTLYDVGENYLVMELLEGESLAERLSRGRLPLAETMRIGAEIATALDRAHRSGVTHRDLKPGNVMLTRSGHGETFDGGKRSSRSLASHPDSNLS